MRQQALLEAIAAVIEGEGISPVYLRRLSSVDGREGIVVRPGPARVRAEYINGAMDVELPVRIICKRRGGAAAMADAEDVAQALTYVPLTVDGVSVEVVCGDERTRELELSDADWHVWEADATAIYRTEAKEVLK